MKSYFFYTDQLTVGYDGKPLIKEINIQLNKGEILTLIGPNGAGKSTILKSITRQLSLISGTVYLEQEQMSRMTNREVSKKLAVVLTERMRPELMTCEDVVSTGRYPYTGTLGILSAEDKEKVKSAMEMVHAAYQYAFPVSEIGVHKTVLFFHFFKKLLLHGKLFFRAMKFPEYHRTFFCPAQKCPPHPAGE